MPTSILSPLLLKQQRPCSGRNIKSGGKSSRSTPCIRTLGKLRKSSAHSYVSSSSRISSSSTRTSSSARTNGTPRNTFVTNSARTSVSQISSKVSQPRICSAGVCLYRRRSKERKFVGVKRKTVSATHRIPKDGEEATRVLSTLLHMWV